jgi:hypothetical protein
VHQGNLGLAVWAARQEHGRRCSLNFLSPGLILRCGARPGHHKKLRREFATPSCVAPGSGLLFCSLVSAPMSRRTEGEGVDPPPSSLLPSPQLATTAAGISASPVTGASGVAVLGWPIDGWTELRSVHDSPPLVVSNNYHSKKIPHAPGLMQHVPPETSTRSAAALARRRRSSVRDWRVAGSKSAKSLRS